MSQKNSCKRCDGNFFARKIKTFCVSLAVLFCQSTNLNRHSGRKAVPRYLFNTPRDVSEFRRVLGILHPAFTKTFLPGFAKFLGIKWLLGRKRRFLSVALGESFFWSTYKWCTSSCSDKSERNFVVASAQRLFHKAQYFPGCRMTRRYKRTQD